MKDNRFLRGLKEGVFFFWGMWFFATAIFPEVVHGRWAALAGGILFAGYRIFWHPKVSA